MFTAGCINFNNRNNRRPTLEEACRKLDVKQQLITLFAENYYPINCRSSLEGVFHFDYQVKCNRSIYPNKTWTKFLLCIFALYEVYFCVLLYGVVYERTRMSNHGVSYYRPFHLMWHAWNTPYLVCDVFIATLHHNKLLGVKRLENFYLANIKYMSIGQQQNCNEWIIA